jgi:hypothetical protein
MNKYLSAAHSIAIPGNARLIPWTGSANFKIKTPHGPLSVEAGRCGSIFCRGTPESIIGFGLIEADWLPGLPGNNATTQTVYFENDGPHLAYGKNRRGKRPTAPHITIRAWGAIKRTVDVQCPISEEQRETVAAMWSALEAQDHHQHAGGPPQRPAYRSEGNVIYLFGGAAS